MAKAKSEETAAKKPKRDMAVLVVSKETRAKLRKAKANLDLKDSERRHTWDDVIVALLEA